MTALKLAISHGASDPRAQRLRDKGARVKRSSGNGRARVRNPKAEGGGWSGKKRSKDTFQKVKFSFFFLEKGRGKEEKNSARNRE